MLHFDVRETVELAQTPAGMAHPNFQMGNALSSSFKFKPFADLFWLSDKSVGLRTSEGVEIFLLICLFCFTLKYKLHDKT